MLSTTIFMLGLIDLVAFTAYEMSISFIVGFEGVSIHTSLVVSLMALTKF